MNKLTRSLVVDSTAMTEAGQLLDAARRELLMSNYDLWLAYFALGGSLPYNAVSAYLAGGSTTRFEHNLLAVALNESFMAAGADHPVPYLS